MTTLPDSQLEHYRNHGFLVVRGVFLTSEIDALLGESKRIWEGVEVEASNPRVQWRLRVDGGRTADRIDPVLDISPLFERTAADPRVIGTAAQILGCTVPELFKSKLISKWPQTSGYALHQDFTYWPGLGTASPDDFVTALLALDGSDDDSGALELFPGQHHHRLPPAADNPRDVDENAVDLSAGVRPELAPGDLVFFHSMTPHRSGPNRSQNNRQSLFFTYVVPGHDGLTRRYYEERPKDFMEP